MPLVCKIKSDYDIMTMSKKKDAKYVLIETPAIIETAFFYALVECIQVASYKRRSQEATKYKMRRA